ncbi:MAG: NAD-dependent epimerase/dehydratase family protein [Actinomycetota bacterium]|nr:NAD-dependent epimerase/dehydratase family protein [Actinomycetota bacterium]
MEPEAVGFETMLVTGGAGFVGSNLAISFKKSRPGSRVIAFDNLKRRGSELNINRLKDNDVRFVHGDIRNPEDLKLKEQIDVIIECSAEASVLAGWGESPRYVLDTNLTGAINCFELARRHGADILFLSTSRVYPFEAINRVETVETVTRFEWDESALTSIPGISDKGISEEFSVSGAKTMYGATKLCSEIILNEYMSMYGIRGVINRCGVIAGPWQFGKVDQGIVALWAAAHVFKRDLSYIGFGGKGKQVRDLVFIDDLFELLKIQLSNLDACDGEVFNIGGGPDMSFSLLELTGICQEVTGNRINISAEPEGRPGDIMIYLSDLSKAQSNLGWQPRTDVVEVVDIVTGWIRDHERALYQVMLP